MDKSWAARTAIAFPCPFCGKAATVYCDTIKYEVKCINRRCKVQPRTVQYKTRRGAIAAWNKRGTCLGGLTDSLITRAFILARTGGNDDDTAFAEKCEEERNAGVEAANSNLL